MTQETIETLPKNAATDVSPVPTFDCLKSAIDGTWLIEASAGTGKTYSLVHLVARLVVEKKIPIDKILLVTFTKAATAELAERVRSLFAQFIAGKNLDAIEEALRNRWIETPEFSDYETLLKKAISEFDDASVCTIHSFCEQMLSEFTFSRAGLYDTEVGDDTTVIHQAVDELLRATLKNPDTSDTLKDEILTSNNWEAIATKLIAEADDVIQNVQFLEKEGEASEVTASEELKAWFPEFTLAVKRRVRELKAAQNITSLNSLLTDFQEAIHESTELLRHVRSRYRAVLIDEFQDTDPVQYDIFKTLFLDAGSLKKETLPTSVIFVGDPKQSIYGFRSAELDTYNEAKKHIKAIAGTKAILQLPRNFRSTPALVETVNAFFSFPNSFLSDIAFFNSEFSKGTTPLLRRVVSSDGSEHYEVVPPFECWTNPSDKLTRLTLGEIAEIENEAIAYDIVRLLEKDQDGKPLTYRKLGANNSEAIPLEAKDIAILVRKRNDASAIIDLLTQYGIRTRIKSEDSVFNTAEAVELHTILNAAIFPENETLVSEALSTSLIGLTLTEITNDVEKRVLFKEHLKDFLEIVGKKGIFPAFSLLQKHYKTLERLLPTKEGERKLTNYRHLLELLQVEQRQTASAQGLATYLGHSIIRATDGENTEESTVRIENNSNVVNVVTIHASKGLEYPVVYLARASCNTVQSRFKSCLFREGKGKNRRFLVNPVGVSPKEHEETYKRDEEECTRLAYVAMTRASSRLVLPLMLGVNANARNSNADKNDNEAKLPFDKENVRSSYIRSLFGESAFDIDSVPRKQEEIREKIDQFSEAIKAQLIKEDVAAVTLSIYQKQGAGNIKELKKLPSEIDAQDLFTFTPLPEVHAALEAKEKSFLQKKKETGAAESFVEADDPVSLSCAWQRPSFTSISRRFLEQPFDATRNAAGFRSFMAGADAGDFLHKLIEKVINVGKANPAFVSLGNRAELHQFLENEFNNAALFKTLKADDTTEFPFDPEALIATKEKPGLVLNAYCYHLAWLKQFFDALLDQPLFTNGPTLANLIEKNRLVSELEFHLSAAPGLTTIRPETIAQAVFDTDASKIVSQNDWGKIQNALNGFLIGEIDLLFKDDAGKYWIVDWKSNKIETENHACDVSANYKTDAMHAVMNQHYYHLQALLYLTALYRYIKSIDPEHDREKALEKIGGAVYVFMRGIGGEPQYGRYFMAIADMREKLLKLDSLFSDKEGQ